MKLSELAIGANGVLAEFGKTPLHLQLLAMGIGPGSAVRLVRRFPLRGNLYVQFGKRCLVMRDAEAGLLLVTNA